ncbi:hypothetical protein IFR05_012869 [Cadophora sp. M221]|nr:hypothetical protein IFR05_012869 [Cadophora sp. M221]
MDRKGGNRRLVPVYHPGARSMGIVDKYEVVEKGSKKKKKRKRAQRGSTSAEKSPARTPDGSGGVPIHEDLDTATPEDSSKSEPPQTETSLSPNTSVSEELDSPIEDDEQPVAENDSVTDDGVLAPSDGSAVDGDTPLSRNSRSPDLFIRENSELELDADVQLSTIFKKRSKRRASRRIADITFPSIHFEAKPEFHALRCDESCPEFSEVDGDELGGAHTWCLTHSRYHCRGIANEACRDFVLCGVSVEVYKRMRVDWLEDVVGSGGDSDDGSDGSNPGDESDSGYYGGKEIKRQKKHTPGKEGFTSFLAAAKPLGTYFPVSWRQGD